MRSIVISVPCVILVLLAGCGQSESADSAIDTDAKLCEHLAQIDVLEKEVDLAPVLAATEAEIANGAFVQFADSLETEFLPAMNDEFNSAIELAPTNLAADLEVMRNATAIGNGVLADSIRGATSIDELSAGLSGLGAAVAAKIDNKKLATAPFEINEFSEDVCGFATFS